MAVIDLCGGGVTKTYVQNKINEAVFESGACTPESVQIQIDESIELYHIDLSTATSEEIIDLVAHSDLYDVVYTYKGKIYRPVTEKRDVGTSGTPIGNSYEFEVTDDEYSLTSDFGTLPKHNIYDRTVLIRVRYDGVILTPQYNWVPGTVYQYNTLDDNQKARLCKRIYDAFQNRHSVTLVHNEAEDFTLVYGEDEFGDYPHTNYIHRGQLQQRITIPVIVSSLVYPSIIRTSVLTFIFDDANQTVVFDHQNITEFENRNDYATKTYVDRKVDKTYYDIEGLSTLPEGVTFDDVKDGKAVLYLGVKRLLPINTQIRDGRPLVVSLLFQDLEYNNLYWEYRIYTDNSIVRLPNMLYGAVEKTMNIITPSVYWKKVYDMEKMFADEYQNYNIISIYNIIGENSIISRSYYSNIVNDVLEIRYFNPITGGKKEISVTSDGTVTEIDI